VRQIALARLRSAIAPSRSYGKQRCSIP
jgi:hypothetical protein